MRFYENLRFQSQYFGYIKRPDKRLYRRVATIGFLFSGYCSIKYFLMEYPQFIENLPYWEKRVMNILIM